MEKAGRYTACRICTDDVYTPPSPAIKGTPPRTVDAKWFLCNAFKSLLSVLVIYTYYIDVQLFYKYGTFL